MPGITVEQAQENLDAWMAASLAVAKGQSYQIADRSLTRADAGEIRENIKFWDQQIRSLEQSPQGGRRVRYGAVNP